MAAGQQLDASEFGDVAADQPAAAAPTAQQQAAPAAQQQAKQLDPNEFGDALPSYADGATPMTPLNASPLSSGERLQLAMGNEKGNIEKLKQRFQEVAKDDHGNLLVKDKDMWHRVDGTVFGDADAWTVTKGLVKAASAAMYRAGGAKNTAQAIADTNPVSQQIYKDPLNFLDALGKAASSTAYLTVGMHKTADQVASANPMAKEMAGNVADVIPTIGKIELAALAGQFMAPYAAAAEFMGSSATSVGLQAGATGIGAGVGEGARTSLGRLEGTYQATPEEQLRDVGYESALNALGVTITAGFRPSAKFIGEKMPGIGKTYNAIGETGKNAIKQLYGAVSGVGSEAFDTLGEYGSRVGAAMRRAADIAGGDEPKILDQFARDKAKEVARTVEQAPKILSGIYRGGQAQLLKSVPSNFSVPVKDLTDDVLSEMVHGDLVGVKIGGKLLTKVEAIEALADPNKLKIAQFVPHSQQALQKSLQETGAIASGATFDKQSHQMLTEFVSTLDGLRKAKTLEGTSGANQLLTSNQILDDLTYKFKLQSEEAGLNEVTTRMAAAHDKIRGAIEKAFKPSEEGAVNLFTAMQENYSTAKGVLADVLQSKKAFDRTGSTKPYLDLVNKITARGGKNVSIKDSFNGVLKLAEDYGVGDVAMLRESQNSLRILDAAEKFTPRLNPTIGRRALQIAGGSAAGLPFSPSASGGVMASALATAAVTSPKLAYRATNAATTLLKPMWAGKQMLEKLGAEGTKTLFSDPAATNAFVSAMLQVPQVQDATKNALLGGGQEQPPQ